MSAVFDARVNELPHTYKVKLAPSEFNPLFCGHASMIFMHPSELVHVGDRLELIEESFRAWEAPIADPTGRELYGLVSHVITSTPFSSLVHFLRSGRTWAMRDEHAAHEDAPVRRPMEVVLEEA